MGIFFFPELREELNGIPPIGGDLSIAIRTATDRASRSNGGEKINLTGQKRFPVFPKGLEFVKVGELNLSAPRSQGGRSLGCSNLWACLLAGLGYFSKVNSLPQSFVHPYIIGQNTLANTPPHIPTISREITIRSQEDRVGKGKDRIQESRSQESEFRRRKKRVRRNPGSQESEFRRRKKRGRENPFTAEVMKSIEVGVTFQSRQRG